jgi:bifunctional non-homologous end joining protein LigD
MLARLVRTLPEGPDWEYELKLDGYRLQAIKDGEKVRLLSRRGNDFTRKFAKIATSVSKIKVSSVILDGEAVVVDNQGKPSFQMLQNRARLPSGWSLAYYVFDLLHLNGADLKDRPLRERRAPLEKLLGDSGVLLSQSLPGTLSQIIQAVKAHGLEGVVAKRLDSKYQPDRRGDDWLKLPLTPSQYFVIGAYRLDGKRLDILLVGQFEPAGSVRHVFSPSSVKKLRTDPAANHPKLLFAGKVHQGLNPANRRALLTLLQPLAIKKCPFANLPTGSPRPSDGRGVRGEGSGVRGGGQAPGAKASPPTKWPITPGSVPKSKPKSNSPNGPPAASSATPNSSPCASCKETGGVSATRFFPAVREKTANRFLRCRSMQSARRAGRCNK